MTPEQLIANYTPAVDVISLILCSVLLFLIAKALFFSNDKKFTFLKRSLLFTGLGSAFNIAFFVVVKYFPQSTILIFVFRDLYHLSFFLCLYCYLLYMKYMIDVKTYLEDHIRYLTRIFFSACVVLDFLSPLTKIGFHIIDGKWYDSILSFYNLFYIYSVLLLFLMLVFYSKRLIRYVRVCLGVTEGVIVCIMTYQGILNINAYTSFTYLFPILVVLILLHSKPFDDKTGALSSESLGSFINRYSKSDIDVDYIVLKLNIDILDTLPSELGKMLNSFWHDSFKKAMSFNLHSDVFVLAIPKEKKNGNIKEKIDYLIESKLLPAYEKYKIPYKLLCLYDLKFIENLTDILGITEYLFVNTEENSIFVLDEKKRNELKIMKQVKETLVDIEKQNNLEDPRILVYYQPIRNMRTGEFDTAEALMRMNLDGIGLVMPFMFITMAEEYGYINTLTKIMLNKVCKNIKNLESEGFSFKRISVNVSALDIKIDGFCEGLINIIKENGVNFSKIGIELTESQTDSDFAILNNKMKILRNAGISLYLDDVGTGYSNLDRIVQYDVDVVKFDRFFLLEAEKSMKNVKMMAHLSQAFQDLDYKLLFEGVETDAHEALCLSCGADYIQGFKYSKPVPFEELKNYFTKGEANPDAANYIAELKKEQKTEKRDFTYKEMQDQYSILITMSKLFYSMHVIDLINNTAKPYNPTEDMRVKDVVNSTIGADVMMKQIMTMCTVDKYVPAVLEFTDLSTIAERMTNKKLLTAQYEGKSIGPYVAAFYTIEADENGKPTKVVFTTRSIEDTKNK